MYKLRLRENRGKTQTDWMTSFHTFSFSQYFDPFHMGFSDLRAINDDIIDPDGGFGMHRHSNMEILSFIFSGELEHKDSTGASLILKPGDVQKISSGSGVMHSEFNVSSIKPVHLLQVWILPDKKNTEPEYERRSFSLKDMKNKFCLTASQDGRKKSLKLKQDAEIYQSVIDVDKTILFPILNKRKIWIQVVEGAVEINSNIMESGDGMSIVDEIGMIEISGVDISSKILLFNLRNLRIE